MTRNLVYSEISISVIVKHVQHAQIIRTFYLPGGTEKNGLVVDCCRDQCPGWHYASLEESNKQIVKACRSILQSINKTYLKPG